MRVMPDYLKADLLKFYMYICWLHYLTVFWDLFVADTTLMGKPILITPVLG